MKFVCYSDWQQIPDSANAVFASAAQRSVFYSRQWLEHVAATLEKDQSLLFACVIADHQVLAVLPLIDAHKQHWYALKHRYSTHFSLLLNEQWFLDRDIKQERHGDSQIHSAEVQPQPKSNAQTAQMSELGAHPGKHYQEVMNCLVSGLKQHGFPALLLEPIAEDDRSLLDLQHYLVREGYECERLFRFYNWVYHANGQSFSDYLANRPAQLRNTLARKQRKLAREHGYNIGLFVGEQVPEAMSDYHSVYMASWKANEQYTDFLNGVVASFAKAGWTRLAVLYVKNKPVAAQLWFVAHRKASIFRLAYDEQWKHYSVGSILTAYLMEHVIDIDQVEEIDFLTGNEAYKQDWMSVRRERYAMSCIRPKQAMSMLAKMIAWFKQ